MTDAGTLVPVVMGIGLVTLSTNHISGLPDARGRPTRHAALFTLAVQLIGFALVGVALSIVAWSAESGRRLGPADVKVENWFIAALALLIVVTVVRNAWGGFVRYSSSSPWDRGFLDRANTFFTFIEAVGLVILLGAVISGILIALGTTAMRAYYVLFTVAALFLVVFGLVGFMIRRLLGADPSPDTVTMSCRQQRRLLHDLADSPGAWLAIMIKPVVEVEPALTFTVTVWSSERGLYWRADDAYALGRYHTWAGDHAWMPVAALHLQRVSVLAGKIRDPMRGMRITQTTRRLWWIDAWRSHRNEPPLVSDTGSPERKAGLVHIGYQQLRGAGLIVTVGAPPAPVHKNNATNGANYPTGGAAGFASDAGFVGAFTRARNT